MTPASVHPAGPRPAAPWLLLAYAAFVVYGSLVPLDFKPIPLARAWADFAQIPFLHLGIESRADWVANGVLYAPLGFWGVRTALQAGLGRVSASVLAVLLCAAAAVGIEFTQLFFPPRTVSQNDIVAECVGSIVGAAVACLAGGWMARLGTGWASGGPRLARRLLELYAVAYTALCFFPYDLLLSAAEVQAKAQSGSWGWLLAPQAGSAALTVLQLLVEVALVLPLGAWLALRSGARVRVRSVPLLPAALLGALFGVLVEVGQFFIATGVSQGASVLARALGFAAGAWCAPHIGAAGLPALRRGLRRPALVLWLPYAALLLAVNGLFTARWHAASGLAAAWAETRLLPFYYHYYTTEAIALASLVSVALMYLPAAVLGWARSWPPPVVVSGVAVLAALVELAKLPRVALHPDPTNIVIAAATAAAALALLALLERAAPPGDATPGTAGALKQPVLTPTARAGGTATGTAASTGSGTGGGLAALPARRGLSPWLLLLPLTALQALLFPVLPAGLLLALAGCAAAVWRWPPLTLALLPAALPLLDLTPWSGRLFWDGYDMLAAVCLAVALHRARTGDRQTVAPTTQRGATLAFWLLAVSLLVSTGVALWPWSALPALLAPGGGAFDTLHSPLNALRIVKGAVWAWLFVLLWQRLALRRGAGARWFGAGMLVGLAGTVAAVLWERAAFAGIWDGAAEFRVSGLWSTMQTGGAFIECGLAVAMAFALGAAMRATRWPLRGAALLLLAGGGYAMAVTYSRNGYAALAVVVGVTLALAASRAASQAASKAASKAAARSLAAKHGGLTAAGPARASGWTQAAWAGGAVAAMAAVALPLALGPYASARLATVGKDLATRQAHWQDGLQLRDDAILTSVFGMGLGRFPATHYWRSQEPVRAASYSLGRDGDGSFLRLGVGATIYVDQIVSRPGDATQGSALTLRAKVRAAPGNSSGNATLQVALCEKWILTSQHCVGAGATARPAVAAAAPATDKSAAWQQVGLPLDATALLAPGPWWRPPLTLSLLTPKEAAIDVTGVQLTTPDGRDLLHNGDFAQGMDRWFFSTDVDPPWQMHSLPLQVLFDQGWFGVAAWAAVLIGAIVIGTRLALQGRAQVPAALPALCGFLVSGSLNSLIDTPRFLWLLLVLAWLASQPSRDIQPAPGVGGARGRDRAA